MTNDTTPITNWHKATLRMQHVGRKHPFCVVTFTAVVEYGELVHWSAPDVHQIEPQAAAHAFLKLLRGVEPIDGET